MIYFTSDLHFNHKNIIKYANRPYKTVQEMNETLIKNYNQVVSPNDTVYILGDCGYGCREQIQQLNGKKILIVGNHDKANEIQDLFIEVLPYTEIKYKHRLFCLFHYPIAEWNGYFRKSIHLHGHQHNHENYNSKNISNKLYKYDVGVDANFYKPISIEDILRHFKE